MEQLDAFETAGLSPPKKKKRASQRNFATDEERKAGRRELQLAWKANNKDRRRETNRIWRANNRERVRDAARRQREKDRGRFRDRCWAYDERHRERRLLATRARRERASFRRSEADAHRRRNYGLAVAEYDAMVLASLGRCGICGRQDSNSKKSSLVVDHCHLTKIVRGLICGYCNHALGFIEQHDDIDAWMSAAQQYLKRAKRAHLHLITKENKS